MTRKWHSGWPRRRLFAAVVAGVVTFSAMGLAEVGMDPIGHGYNLPRLPPAPVETLPAPAPASAPASKAPSMPLAELLKRLGSADFTVRQAAQAEMDALPPGRISELLALAARESDPEIVARVQPRLGWVKTSFKLVFGAAIEQYDAVGRSDFFQDDTKKPWGFDLAGHKPEEFVLVEGPTPTPYIGSEKPFYFSVAVPEGNYRVTVGAAGPADVVVRAELRRLMVEHLHVEPGYQSATFVVNVRSPFYPGGKVSLKAPRETTDEAWAWDGKLTLELAGKNPNLGWLKVEKLDVPTVYLLGDSTMCDQAKEPYNSWGQMLPRFFDDTVAIANHAESGETVASALAAHRFDKILSVLKKGDYVMFAFGHNDQKAGGVPLETYKADYRKIIAATKEKGAMPVVISSMERMNGIEKDTLGDYPAAAKQVAEEEHVAFIDLHAMSKVMYRAMGTDLPRVFAVDNGKQDQTHTSDFGSYEISKLVLEGIRQNHLDLAQHVRKDVEKFDPAHPGTFAEFQRTMGSGDGPAGK